MKLLKLRDNRQVILSNKEAAVVVENLKKKQGTYITRLESYFTFQTCLSVELPEGMKKGETVFIGPNQMLMIKRGEDVLSWDGKRFTYYSSRASNLVWCHSLEEEFEKQKVKCLN